MLLTSLQGFLALLAVASAAPNEFPTPQGGVGLTGTPQYRPLSDFDFQSFNLALNQEWIELDLFHHGLAMFSKADFDAAGINAEYRYLIQFMAEQEVGHAKLVSNILQGKGARQCKYKYPFKTVRGFVDFCQKLTRWGESGVYGFLQHLNSRAAANLLLQSITTEARQQMIFKQLEGLFPMPIWFLPGITQSMTWSLLSQFIVECPGENPHVKWQNFPTLTIDNNPSGLALVDGGPGKNTFPAVSRNRTIPLSFPGRQVHLSWDAPGKKTGYNNSFTTTTDAGRPKASPVTSDHFVAWISHLNTTYSRLENIRGRTGTTIQPNELVFPNTGANTPQVVNGTMFIMVTDDNPHITVFNVSMLNRHVVAGPGVYQAG